MKTGSNCGIKTINEGQNSIMRSQGWAQPEKKVEVYTEKKLGWCYMGFTRNESGVVYAGAKATDCGTGVYKAEAKAGTVGYKKGKNEVDKLQCGANAEFGLGGAIAEADASHTTYSHTHKQGSIDVGKSSADAGVGIGAGGYKAKATAGYDFVDTNTNLGGNVSMKANVGVNCDTGVEGGTDGVSASFLGFGGSVGRNTGISTPFGSLKFKLF